MFSFIIRKDRNDPDLLSVERTCRDLTPPDYVMERSGRIAYTVTCDGLTPAEREAQRDQYELLAQQLHAVIPPASSPCGECGGTYWVIVKGGEVVCGNCGGPRAPRCEYKPLCPNVATTTVEIAALRDLFPDGVPACDSCAEYVAGVKDQLAVMEAGE